MIRYLVLAVGLLVLLGIPVAVISSLWRYGQTRPIAGRQRLKALERATWQAHSQLLDNRTVVSVRKVIAIGGEEETVGQMTVAEITADDPEWDVKVSQALMDARVRADILNAENRQIGP